MKSPRRILIIPLALVLISLIAQNLLQVLGEQPSTVFVLDTSDSDPAPVSYQSQTDSATAATTIEPGTRIISDDQQTSTNQHQHQHHKNQKYQNSTQQHQRPTTAPAAQTNNYRQPHDRQHNATQSTTLSPSSVHGQHSQAVTSRRLEEAAQLAPATNKPSSNGVGSHQQQHNAAHKQKHTASTTTTSLSNSYDNSESSHVPKSEERLLISITSEDPDDPYKKVSSSSSAIVGPSNGGGYEEPQTLTLPNSQPIHHHQKRKPSITISIQDANINKQNGGSGGTQAVIVRPGDDGQSIVIATVGSSSSNNKYKPSQIGSDTLNIPLAGQSSQHQPTHNQNQQQRPYNEPINNPIQGIIAQHQITSTTRRPPPLNDYQTSLNQNNNRPITSTLIEGQRPPIQSITDERPQRPIQASGLDERPTNPLRPNSEPYSGSNNNNNNNNQDYEPSTSSNSNGNQQNDYQNNGDEQRKYPLNEKNCGVMHETRIVGGEEADPDDFMWMAAIIKSKPNNGEPRPFCGGSLITRRHILTAAHCLEGLAPRDVLVRLGSYDFEDSASSSSADYAIDQFRVPAQYSKKTHVADLAIMRLKTPLSLSDQYKTVCMPQLRRSYVGAFGLVTGYGSQSQTFRKAAPKLRQVTVPIWENRKCSKVYNKTMGDSFLCAGYEEGGKDACQGDSGGPIMTEGPDQKMMIVGVVSHGIGCGSPGYPGVYTRTSTFAEWIEKNTRE